MKTPNRRVWRSGDTWRNVAFKYFQDSREWRYLLELNPSYDIRFEPSPTTSINIDAQSFGQQGKNRPRNAAAPGRLVQLDVNLNLSGGVGSSTNQRSQQTGIFPWETFEDYANRVGDYTGLALLTPDRTNGFSLDSPQATSDTQRAQTSSDA